MKHGGLTPRGDAWHRTTLPANPARLERKLAALARRRQRLAARLAEMSEDERRVYEKQSRERQPGTVAERAMRKRDREMVKLLGKPVPRPIDPAAAALEAELEAIRARKARLQVEIARDAVPVKRRPSVFD